MRILVTGGAGYVGSILVGQLLRDEHEVVVIDDFRHGVPSLALYCTSKKLKIVRGDARDLRLVMHYLHIMDVFVPLAALVGAPLCERSKKEAIETNFHAVRDTLAAMSRDQMVIAPISNSGYGVGADGVCTEETPMNPISVYGQTKVDAEKAIMDRGNAISLRLATVFGWSGRMRTDLLVNDFVLRAVRDRAIVLFESHFRRNYVHVRDVATAFSHSISRFHFLKDQAYNVGLSNANLTKYQLCECIRPHVPELQILEAPTGEDPDKRDYLVSNAKIEATGWGAQYSLDDGIRELVLGYQMLRSHERGNA